MKSDDPSSWSRGKLVASQPSGALTQQSGAEGKIRLFRSLFRGREDVYPRRFESRRTGKAGFQPACGNEWVRGVCEKPQIKCNECPHQRFLPFTDEVARWHLSGKDPHGDPFAAGVFPMLLDETCWFLAIDLDKEGWRLDATALMELCARMELPVAMDTRPGLGLNSYDRLFPNQDTLPKRGFGTLIELPLQFGPRQNGNSVFVTPDFEPHPDQWAFLSSMRKVSPSMAEEWVKNAKRHGTVHLSAENENSSAASSVEEYF